MSSTRRALAFSFLDRYAALALAIGSSMVVARLLTPTEIGVFSVTMVLLSFTASLRDFGAGQYLLQEKDLTNDRIRATWAVQSGTGLLFCVVVLLASVPVSRFYGDPRMAHIMWVVSLNFAINPFGSLTYAWLMREMRFESLAVMRFSSGLVGACVSVYLAWRGLGPISLAIGNLMATVTNSVIAVYFRPAHFPWWPGTREIKRVLSFGGKFSAAGIMETLNAGTPELLLGKLQSLTMAGYYSRASGLTSMFQKMVLDATNSVMLPLFAKEYRQHGNINDSLVQAMAYVTALGWSFFLGLGLMAFPVVRLLYGTQWDQSVDLVRLLSVALAIALPAALCPLALSATGAVNRLVLLTAVTVSINVIFLALGAWQGLAQIGWALIGGQSVCAAVWLIYTRRKLKFSARALGRVWLRSAVVALVTALAPLAACMLYGFQPATIVAPMILTLIGGPLLFVCATYSTGHPIFEELRSLWRRIFSANTP